MATAQRSIPSRCLLGALLVSPPALWSCAGSSSGGTAPGNELSGRIDAAEFTIAAGETRTVVGDVIVRTTGPIRIDGTLLVRANVSVDLVADGPLTIAGSIRPDGPAPAAFAEDKHVLLFGDGVTVSGEVESRHDLYVAVMERDDTSARFAETQIVRITGTMTTSDGRHATNANENGGDAATIFLCEQTANELARSKGGKPGPARAIQVGPDPPTAANKFFVRPGNGGNGFSDVAGTRNGKSLSARGSNGGKGGNLLMAADTMVIAGNTSAGNGGHGGDAGPPRSADSIRALDGTQNQEDGGNATAIVGAGGDGGTVAVRGSVVIGLQGLTFRAGDGGNAGSTNVQSGRGGPSGKGGAMVLQAAKPGVAGRAEGFTPSEPAMEGEHTVFVMRDGAMGGESLFETFAGGAGGAVEFRDPDQAQFVIQFSRSVANGGAGFDGCAVLPRTLGTQGGKGGTSSVQLAVQGAWSGGRGGDDPNGGQPGGERGQGPTGPMGQEGPKGSGCQFQPQTTVGEGYIAVILEHDLGEHLKAGDVVPLIRIRGGHAANVEPGCNSDHLHSHGEGIEVTLNPDEGRVISVGRFPDPNGPGCGYGKLTVIPVPFIQHVRR
ncbi:MAG: hypothetical protein ACK4XJ_06675 [Fimbriimonadaceae bacterium]